MNKLFIIVAATLTLSACGQSAPIKSIGDIPEVKPVQIPALTGRYGNKVERLPDLSGADLETQQRDAVDADIAYNDVADRFNTLVDIYNCVRDTVNTKDAEKLDECLGVGNE